MTGYMKNVFAYDCGGDGIVLDGVNDVTIEGGGGSGNGGADLMVENSKNVSVQGFQSGSPPQYGTPTRPTASNAESTESRRASKGSKVGWSRNYILPGTKKK